MARTTDSQNTFWMSRLKETAFGTRVAAAGPYVRIRTTDRAPVDVNNETADDAAEAHGSDIAENVWNTTHGADKTFPLRFNFQDIGYWLQMALGSASVSGTTELTHVFTPQLANTSRQLPSRTFGEKLGGTEINIYDGGCVNVLSISGAQGNENNGSLQVSAAVMGNGLYAKDPASYAQPALTTGLVYGFNQQASLNLDDGDAIDKDYTCDLSSWSWNLNNNLVPQYDNCAAEFEAGNPEGGYIKNGLHFGTRDYTFDFTAYLETNDVIRTSMKAGTKFTITHLITSTQNIVTTPYSLSLVHTRAQLVDAPRPVNNNYNMVSGTLRLLSLDGAIPLTATLKNNVTSYII